MTLVTVPLTLSHTLLMSTSELNLPFDNAICSASLQSLGMSGLGSGGNLNTWCRSSFVDIMIEYGNYCIEVFLGLVWVHPYCSNWCGQYVTPEALQQESPIWSWNKALVSTFHWIFLDNMVTCHIMYFSQFHAFLHRTIMSAMLTQFLMLSCSHVLGLATWSR